MSPENSFIYKKEPKELISCSGQLEPTWRGPVAGGVLIYTHIGGYGFESRCARAFFLLAFGALGRKSQRAQKGELCAAAMAEMRVWGLAAGRLFFRLFSMRVLRFIMLGDCWGQKHGFRPRRTGRAPEWWSEARNACFGITGARNRRIPTLLPYETCTQTPLDRPKLLFRRDPDFADAPETAQNGGFRRHFAAARFFRETLHTDLWS